MVKLETQTKSFRFTTEDEHPKEFILSYNGENLAINTKGNFISIVDFEIARLKVNKALGVKAKQLIKNVTRTKA